MRENGNSSSEPESQRSDEDDSKWESAISIIAFLLLSAIVGVDQALHKLRKVECPMCNATFLSLRKMLEHIPECQYELPPQMEDTSSMTPLQESHSEKSGMMENKQTDS